MTIEHYIAPQSLEEAAQVLSAGEVTILAGGTDLMPQTNAGRVKFKSTLMNIRRVPELSGISETGNEVRIGALTSIAELMDNAIIRRHFPVLVEAGDHFASGQIRNAGTLGGNVCNASPAGDTLVPLLVLDAKAELVSKPNGTLATRVVPLTEFFMGPGRTQRAPNELLAAIRIPLPAASSVARFFKFGTRPALDISAISIGIAAVVKAGVLSNVRVAYGAVAPTPVRGRAAEAALEGQRLTPETIGAAAVAARDEIQPISDVRASAWYRKELVHNMTKRMLEDVAAAGN